MGDTPPLGYEPGPLEDTVRCLICKRLLPLGRVEGHTETHRKRREADD